MRRVFAYTKTQRRSQTATRSTTLRPSTKGAIARRAHALEHRTRGTLTGVRPARLATRIGCCPPQKGTSPTGDSVSTLSFVDVARSAEASLTRRRGNDDFGREHYEQRSFMTKICRFIPPPPPQRCGSP
ncbi:unnamed protein product [Lampetra planeri]